MISDLNALPAFQTEIKLTVSTTKIIGAIPVHARIKQFFKWLNPNHWFSSLSDIDIDMSEFACKKAVQKSE